MADFIAKYRATSPNKYNHANEFGFERAARICNELGVPHVVCGDDVRLASPSKEMIRALIRRGIIVSEIQSGRICTL